jgi:hypothetical protein
MPLLRDGAAYYQLQQGTNVLLVLQDPDQNNDEWVKE